MSKRRNSFIKLLQLALFACGGLALAYSASVLVRGYLYQSAAERQMKSQARASEPLVVPGAPQSPVAPRAPAVADGMPLATFEIPRLKMDLVVVEGDSDEDLRLGPGHIPGTALPGAIGNVGIAGHRDTVFRPLRNIHSGDVITLTSAGAEYQYQVEATEIVTPDRSDVLRPTPDRSLTLVTCFPFYYVGSAPKRFIVHARAIDTGTPSSTGQ